MNETSTLKKMPVVFLGHGSPMNAVERNEFSLGWARLAGALTRPRAILCVSAHWLTEGTAVTTMEEPRTIHDFYGFPDELYTIRYGAPGSPECARMVQEAVTSVKVETDREWGLDHGTWSVLIHLYPGADIPVLQLSLDYYLAPEKLFAIGRELSVLRKEGVLIIGSGNIVHNLMMIRPGAPPYGWAKDFDAFVAESLALGDHDALIGFSSRADASRAHPTIDHYLPLLYARGAAADDTPEFFNAGFFAGSVSMRCAVFGAESGTIS